MSTGNLFNDFSSLSPNLYESNYKDIMQPFADKQATRAGYGGKTFTQRWQPFMYACILGILNERKIPYISRKNDRNMSGDVFKYSVVFNNGHDIIVAVILSIIAINENGYKILDDLKQLNQEISDYANGGFEIIREMQDDGTSFSFTDFMKEIRMRN